jgi:hypothetical protein
MGAAGGTVSPHGLIRAAHPHTPALAAAGYIKQGVLRCVLPPVVSEAKLMFSRDQYNFHCEPVCMTDSQFCALVIITRSTNRAIVASRILPAERFDQPEEVIWHATQWATSIARTTATESLRRRPGPSVGRGRVVQSRGRDAVCQALSAAFR